MMHRTLHAGLLAVLTALAVLGSSSQLRAAPARTTELAVEVVDVAGGRAYLAPGEGAGLRAGDIVRFGTRRYEVLAVSASTALVDLKGQSLRRGARGKALVRESRSEGPRRLAKPRELAGFRGQWPVAKRPALGQHPKAVPLGPMAPRGATRVTLGLTTLGSVPLASAGSAWMRGELRARVRSEPWQSLPLTLDADLALQLALASDASLERTRPSRPLLRVRALELAYGTKDAWLAAAGRLRYAARSSGMLDGAKLQAPLAAGLTLGAYGGLVPDPLSGKPGSDAARFGAELAWEDLSAELRPRMVLGASGSRFDGALDERRLDAVIEAFPGRSNAGAYASLSLFDSDNPWNAAAQELSAAGAYLTGRFGEIEVGGRVDMQRPERSRWLASFLPAGWFCTRAAGSTGPADACRPDDARLLLQGDVGLRRADLLLTLGGTASRTMHVDSDQLGGFASASFLRVAEVLRIDGSVMAQTGSLLDSAALSVGAGTLLADDRVDVSVHYRPALTRYTADTSSFIEHELGIDLLWMLPSSMELSLVADAIAGRELSVLLVQSTVSWRPESF